MTVTGSFSPGRVTVSTTEASVPRPETRVTAIGQNVAAIGQGQEAAAIDCLITCGWILGCDGELYPPATWRRTVA